jgi:CubicO group peptidase (beta-lactamase class C family)
MMADAAFRFSRVRDLLQDAIRREVFPCATIEVGRTNEVLFQDACGRHTYAHTAPVATIDTIFDLASMTKVLATTTIVMRLVDEGRLTLDDPVRRWIGAWQGVDRRTVTLADLLEHASGLTAHLPFYRDHTGRVDFEHAISTLPLEYPPRTRSIYSDLGFILLGFLATDAANGADLDRQFTDIAQLLQLGDIRYRPPSHWRPRIARTVAGTPPSRGGARRKCVGSRRYRRPHRTVRHGTGRWRVRTRAFAHPDRQRPPGAAGDPCQIPDSLDRTQ